MTEKAGGCSLVDAILGVDLVPLGFLFFFG